MGDQPRHIINSLSRAIRWITIANSRLQAVSQGAAGWTRNRPIAAGGRFFDERPVYSGD